MPKINIAKNLPSTLASAIRRRSTASSSAASGSASATPSASTSSASILTTLEPGAASALRHWHEKEDELVYILEGEVVLIEDEGETVLKPGDAAGFKANAPNGHHLVNRTQRDAIYLEIGTRSKHETASTRMSTSSPCATTPACVTRVKTASPTHELHPLHPRRRQRRPGAGTLEFAGALDERHRSRGEDELAAIVEQVAADAAIKGVVITSARTCSAPAPI